MFILKLVRKVFSLLRSKLTPHEVAFGFCLGILFGCIPLSSWAAAFTVLLLVLVFRSSVGAFLLAAALVKLLSPVLDPVVFRLGEAALEGPAQGFFAWAVNRPVLALLDLHRYLVAGGMLFFLLASVICYPVLFFLVRRYRTTLLKWSETSPRFRKFTAFPLVKFFTWLLMGKRKADWKELTEFRRSPIRKGGVIFALSFAGLFSLFFWLFGDAVAQAGFEGGLSRVLDAEVDTEDLAVSLLRGSLDVENCLVLDRDAEGHIARAVRFSGDLGVRELLRKHLRFDSLAVEHLDFRLGRDEEGRLNLERKAAARERRRRARERARKEGGGGLDLSRFMGDEDFMREVVDFLRDRLFPTPEEAARREAARKEELLRARYADRYADFLVERDLPFLVVDELSVTGFDLRLEDRSKGEARSFTNLELRATALSSNPRLYGKDSEITLTSGDPADPVFELRAHLDWSHPEPEHTLHVRFRELPAEKVLTFLRPGKGIEIKEGFVSMDSETRFLPGGIESVNRFRLRKARFEPGPEGGKILGLDGALFCRGLNAFLRETPLETVVTLSGPYERLSVKVDEKGLLDSVKQGILRTGDKLLQEQLQNQLGRAGALAEAKRKEAERKLEERKKELREKLEEKAGGALGKELGDGLEKGLGGLLGGKKGGGRKSPGTGEKGPAGKKKKKGGGLLDGVQDLLGGKKKSGGGAP